jgi:hypothetical protein
MEFKIMGAKECEDGNDQDLEAYLLVCKYRSALRAKTDDDSQHERETNRCDFAN